MSWPEFPYSKILWYQVSSPLIANLSGSQDYNYLTMKAFNSIQQQLEDLLLDLIFKCASTGASKLEFAGRTTCGN